MVDYLNRSKSYKVHLEGQGKVADYSVEGVRAVPVSDVEAVADEIENAGLVITAVGCANLPVIEPLIKKGLRRRNGPVNVLGFENFSVYASSDLEFAAACGCYGCSFGDNGFSPVIISRIMSDRTGDPAAGGPVVFVGDHPSEFIVDGRRLVGPVPKIKGMRVVEDYDAWAQKKLFTFSAGHATTAYLGYLKGYHYIHTAIRDPEIREAVISAMKEGSEGLKARYGPALAAPDSEINEIIARFENAALNDSIERVGRDPLRKLGKADRLIGPARLAERAGLRPEKLMLAVAAALYFCGKKDPSCLELIHKTEEPDAGRILREVSGLDPATGLARSAMKVLSRLSGKRSGGYVSETPLLSLRRFFWA